MAIFKLDDKIPNFTLPAITGQEFTLETHLKEHKGWNCYTKYRSHCR